VDGRPSPKNKAVISNFSGVDAALKMMSVIIIPEGDEKKINDAIL